MWQDRSIAKSCRERGSVGREERKRIVKVRGNERSEWTDIGEVWNGVNGRRGGGGREGKYLVLSETLEIEWTGGRLAPSTVKEGNGEKGDYGSCGRKYSRSRMHERK